jgi:hypothetical protein
MDFSAGEAFALQSNNLTITGTGGFDFTSMQMSIWTATSSYGLVQSQSDISSAITLYSVPAADLAGADVQELALSTGPFSGTSGRQVFDYFASVADMNEAIGPQLSSPTVTVLSSSPYVRMRGQLASQPGYDTFARFGYLQTLAANDQRFIIVGVSKGYLGSTPSVWNVTIPSFGAVNGLQQSWMLKAGQSTQFFADAYSGRTELLFGGFPVAGDRVALSYFVSSTSSARAFRSMLPAPVRDRRGAAVANLFRKPAASRAQYFSR